MDLDDVESIVAKTFGGVDKLAVGALSARVSVAGAVAGSDRLTVNALLLGGLGNDTIDSGAGDNVVLQRLAANAVSRASPGAAG
jgi:Ca2+-binding RTX toxin-like protein